MIFRFVYFLGVFVLLQLSTQKALSGADLGSQLSAYKQCVQKAVDASDAVYSKALNEACDRGLPLQQIADCKGAGAHHFCHTGFARQAHCAAGACDPKLAKLGLAELQREDSSLRCYAKAGLEASCGPGASLGARALAPSLALAAEGTSVPAAQSLPIKAGGTAPKNLAKKPRQEAHLRVRRPSESQSLSPQASASNKKETVKAESQSPPGFRCILRGGRPVCLMEASK